MASRTLLQLFTLSIIITNQIEARTSNSKHDLEKNQQYDIIATTPVNNRSVKANANDGNNTVLMKKINSHFDQHSDTNAETRNNILSRNKYDLMHKNKGNEEADSDKSQAEDQSDENLKSNAKTTSNRIELTSSDNRKHFSNEGKCSEETNQVNSIKRKLAAEVMAQTIATEKVKQEGETILEPNDETLQNDVEKDHRPTVKPVRRQKQLTIKPCYTKSRTTQASREKQVTHKRCSEFENKICKTKHSDYKNHRSFDKISREHNVYKLKRRDEFKTASKGNNKKKYNMKIKHRHNKRHRALKTLPQENAQYKLKYRDIEKPVLSNPISMENDIYVRKHIIDDFATVDETVTDNDERKYINDSATVEESVSKQVKNPKYKLKFSNHFQKKRLRDKTVRKARHTDKTKPNPKTKKHDYEIVISKQEKYKPTLKEDRDSVFETHTNIHEGDNERNANSGDILDPDDTETSTIENQDEKETLESNEELFKQNDLLNKPKLPFYVSTTTKRAIKEIFKKQPKKLVAQKKETDILLHDLSRVLKGNSDLINQNIDLNTTISRLASSKILDFITDRLAGQMLKKLENSLASKKNLRTKEENPETIEQFDILFKKNGAMVMMVPEDVKEKQEDKMVSEKHFTRNKHAY